MVVESESKLFTVLGQLVAEIRELRGRINGATKAFLTVEEVADLTGRAEYTIRTWIKHQKIRAIRVNGTGPRGRLLVPREELSKILSAGHGSKLPEIATTEIGGQFHRSTT